MALCIIACLLLKRAIQTFEIYILALNEACLMRVWPEKVLDDDSVRPLLLSSQKGLDRGFIGPLKQKRKACKKSWRRGRLQAPHQYRHLEDL